MGMPMGGNCRMCFPWNVCPGERSRRSRLWKGLTWAGTAGGHLICPNSFRQEFLKGWIFTEKEYMLKSVLAVYRALVEKMEASKIYVLLEVLLQRRQWHPIPVLLPGESQGWGSLVGCRLWGRIELDMTEVMQQQQQTSC